MIDTHSHLLPGLDDGPSNDAESAHLARQLVRDGVTYVLCTPHFSRVYPTSLSRARSAFQRLHGQLADLEIPLQIGLAAEVNPRLLGSPPDELRERAVDGRYLIVELDRSSPAAVILDTLAALRALRLIPVFAHPERCSPVRTDRGLIREARREGALFQVVVPSLAGRWGDDVAQAAWALLDAGYVDLVATDAHRPSRTGRTLRAILDRIEAVYGRAALEELSESAPLRMLGLVAAAPDAGRAD